jgi:hypothetical protein
MRRPIALTGAAVLAAGFAFAPMAASAHPPHLGGFIFGVAALGAAVVGAAATIVTAPLAIIAGAPQGYNPGYYGPPPGYYAPQNRPYYGPPPGYGGPRGYGPQAYGSQGYGARPRNYGVPPDYRGR